LHAQDFYNIFTEFDGFAFALASESSLVFQAELQQRYMDG